MFLYDRIPVIGVQVHTEGPPGEFLTAVSGYLFRLSVVEFDQIVLNNEDGIPGIFD